MTTMSTAAVRTSQAPASTTSKAPSSSSSSSVKVEERTSKPIQWATSTGATVLQQLAASRDKLKGSSLTRDDLINSKPGTSTTLPNRGGTSAGSSSTSTSTTGGSNGKKSNAAKNNPTNLHVAKARNMPDGNTAAARASVASTASSSPSTSAGDAEHNKDPDSLNEKKPARRRKANRACSHCQKAHLTCDDSRPCERCVKKGLADSCTDGARKKAKYLLDDDELAELKREKERKRLGLAANKAQRNGIAPPSSASPSSAAITLPNIDAGSRTASPGTTSTARDDLWGSAAGRLDMANFAQPQPPSSQIDALSSISEGALSLHPQPSGDGTGVAGGSGEMDQQQLYAGPLTTDFSPASSGGVGMKGVFDSEQASLEYSILSSMLNGIDPSWLSGSPENHAGGDTDVSSGGGGGGVGVLPNGAYSHMGIDSMPWQFSDASTASPWKDSTRLSNSTTTSAVQPLHHLDTTLSMGSATAPTPADGVAAYDALEVPSPKDGSNAASLVQGLGRNAITGGSAVAKQNGTALTHASEQDVQNSKAAAAAAAAGLDHKPDALWKERVKHIYGDKTRPFPYTEGYHFLIKYVTANLDKADVLRIVRALAIFRPSLIALQMPLTEDDEVFVERSIQRTILEFEKLISFSGTPTVVWRRTCEIVVVGAEFSMLTQWSKDALMGRYIYEFFEKPSILEYWEKFAMHAFENTAQSIMMPVTLKTSAGTSTRCAACFSIKRDIFDLPSLIVGNFLPILS